MDTERVYPNREWLRVVEEDRDRATAEAKALRTLAQAFRVDVRAMTQAAQTLESRQGKKTSAQRIDLDVQASTEISGIIGAERDVWTDRAGGKVYALIRMNRAQCAARYRSLIEENERTIAGLLKKAEENSGSFEAWSALNSALPLAEQTGTLTDMLGVLDPAQGLRRPAYGGAAAVAARLKSERAAIVIAVQVDGDTGGRIAGAFSSFLTGRGFRAGEGGAEQPYTLRARFVLEDKGRGGSEFTFASFSLSARLADRDDKELFAWQDTDREGHTNTAGAQERALMAAEKLIRETDFAAAFDEWLGGI
jgi:hypothetical protein